MKYLPLVLLFAVFALYSCGKKEIKTNDDTPPTKTEINPSGSQTESDVADSLSKEELFSTTLVQDIAGDENEDLQVYLEDTIYPMVAKSHKVTLDKISGSLYLLSFEENGKMKNILIQEFFDPQEEDVMFDKREVSFDAVKQFVK